jgi:prevent-host-death family protein
MQITLTELKTNTGKYISLADNEDVFVTRNGKRVAKITRAKIDKIAAAKALFGILPPDTDLDKARQERLK